MRKFELLLIAALAAPLTAQEQQAAQGWDFVPGEKILLYDDFTDMAKGAAPPHWRVRGGSVQLGANGRLIAPKTIELYPNIAKWPQNFTIDHEVTFEKGAEEEHRKVSWTFLKDDDWTWYVSVEFSDDEEACRARAATADNEIGASDCHAKLGQAATLSLWLQEGRLRVYVNQERVIDANQLQLPAWNAVKIETENNTNPVSFAKFRIAESTPDISKTLFATGRYVTHGIQFDVNSDRVRPESGPVLKQIAEALQKQPALKLRVEGHTDSSGDAAKNLDLSKRRAQSVVQALTTQYGIAADRLTAEGLGASKPAAGNDTPQGRAENRRVEFVKI